MQSLHTEKQFKPRYLIIPDFVFQNGKLTYMAAKVYAFIHNYRMPDFFFGNEKLAEMFGCSESAITKAISQLKEENYIATRFDGRKRYIDDLFITQRVVKKYDPESDSSATLVEAGESDTFTTLNTPNQEENEAEDEDFGVPNKNININNIGNFEKKIESLMPSNRKSSKPKKPFDRQQNFPGYKSNPSFPERLRGGLDYSDVV